MGAAAPSAAKLKKLRRVNRRTMSERDSLSRKYALRVKINAETG
jgi:hypothetical protein